MEKNEFNSIVLRYFDSLKNAYYHDVEIEWDGEAIGSTILIEDYLMPYIYTNIDNVTLIENLSCMLEEILSYDDEYCEEVLYSSFFEKIHYDNFEEKFTKFYKEKTKKFFEKLVF